VNYAAKLLKEKNFRVFRYGTECIFPSWTSWVRIPSPAIVAFALCTSDGFRRRGLAPTQIEFRFCVG
jgi:hypothetical protein